jgi:glycosyltransferase involved in cell wall biosynthesis
MRRVLMVASHILSGTVVGSIRPLKFVKYLPEFDWQPIVLTRGTEGQASLNRIEAPVFQVATPSFESLSALGRRLLPAQALQQYAEDGDVHQAGTLSGRSQRLSSWLFVPDNAMPWMPFVVRMGLKVAQKHRPAAIFSTSPDWSCLLVASRLSQRLSLPWIADFRDPWVSNPFVSLPTRFHRWLHICLERRAVSAADLVVTVSQALLDDFVARYPSEPLSKFRVITNGFDSDDFSGHPPAKSPTEGQVRVVHNGTFFYAGKDPFPFLRAVKRLDAHPDFVGAQIDFVGVRPALLGPAITEMGLEHLVNLVDFVPHRESLRYLMNGDILLLVPGPGRGVLTNKVFEYLATGKPILALVSRESAVADLLTEANVGMVVDPDSPTEIADGLLQMVQRVQEGRSPQPNWEFIQQFSRRELTRQLASSLDALYMKHNP